MAGELDSLEEVLKKHIPEGFMLIYKLSMKYLISANGQLLKFLSTLRLTVHSAPLHTVYSQFD